MNPLHSEISFSGDRPAHVHAPNLRVYQREFAHDVASVNLVQVPGRVRHLETGTPVTVRWGWPPNGIGTFLGYVNHTEPVQARGQNLVKVVCTGASTPMKGQRQQAWQGRNIPSVVREIIRSHQLSGVVQDDMTVFPSLSANGVSDWAFLVGLAQRLGWTLFAHGTDVVFRDPLADVFTLRSQAPLWVGTPPSRVAAAGGRKNLLSFKVVDGHTPDGGKQGKRVTHGLDPRLLQSFSVSDAGGNFNDQLGAVSPVSDRTIYERLPGDDVGGVLQSLAGEARRNRWHIQAKASVVGDVSVHQSRLVSILGAGPRENGYWYVEGVEHEVTTEAYRMHVTLGRDSSWDTGERPDLGRPRRVVRPRNDPFGAQRDEIPPSVLVNRKWRAAYSVERAVSGVA